MSDKENAQTPPHEEDPIKQEPSDDDQDQDQPEPEQAPQPQAQRRRRPRPPPYQQDSMDSNTALDRPRRQQRRQRRQPLGGDDGGPLGGLGGVNQAGDLVQNTAGNAVNGVTNTAGKAVGGLLGGNKGEEKDDGGRDEQLRLRLDLNLDIEVQLKAKIHGDLTLGLLYVSSVPGDEYKANAGWFEFVGTKTYDDGTALHGCDGYSFGFGMVLGWQAGSELYIRGFFCIVIRPWTHDQLMTFMNVLCVPPCP